MKFKALKNWRESWLPAMVLSLAFLHTQAFAAPAEMHEVTCELKENDFIPDYHKGGHALKHCQPAGNEKLCFEVLERIDKYSEGIRKFKTETCTKVSDTARSLGAIHGVDTQYTESINLYAGVLHRYEILNNAITQFYNDMKRGMEPVLQDPAIPEDPNLKADRLTVQTEIKDQTKLLNNRFKATPTSDITKDPHKRDFAIKNGVNFMKDLLREQKETQAAKEKLSAKLSALRIAQDKLRTVPPPTNGPGNTTGGSPVAKGGGGLNPTALMGLASAAAGLAGMMNKQQADSGMPAATSPTPESLNPPTEKPTIAVSKLDGGKSSSPGKVDIQPKSIDTNVATAAPSVPSGQGFVDDSDISNSTPPPTAQAAPASSKAPGGGGGGGGGGGDSGGQPVARELSGGAEHKEEEAMQGIGGGGLGGGPGGGGGGGGSGSEMPMDPAVAAAEDSMKDLLTEMKETADSGDSSPAEAQSGIMEMDAEDLFPRVRAAHVRSLKQGRVLNGLGEKITPDAE